VWRVKVSGGLVGGETATRHCGGLSPALLGALDAWCEPAGLGPLALDAWLRTEDVY